MNRKIVFYDPPGTPESVDPVEPEGPIHNPFAAPEPEPLVHNPFAAPEPEPEP